MKIRHSTENDINRMMEIYAYARNFMAEHGNPNQWGPTNWPPRELIENDIKTGNSFVCINDNGKVIGTFFLIEGPDIEPTYKDIECGSWMEDPDNSTGASAPVYGVVHRLAGDGSEKGIGAFCLEWAFEKCGHIRVDTHSDNIVMQNLFTKLGYEKRGIIHVVEDNYPRYAYEKIKSSVKE